MTTVCARPPTAAGREGGHRRDAGRPVTLDVDGFGQVVFCHGTPRDDDEVVLVDTRLERWAEAFAGLADEVRTVVCGHTHTPFTRLVDRRLVVNPGSVGMPYGRVGGAWALLRDGQVSLRHTLIDPQAVCARIVAESAYPTGPHGPTSTSGHATVTPTPSGPSRPATAGEPLSRRCPGARDPAIAADRATTRGRSARRPAAR